MRDASIDDMAGLWIASVMEKSDWARSSKIYLAIIGQIAHKYFAENLHSPGWEDQAVELRVLLEEILTCLPTSPDEAAVVTDSWMVPTGILVEQAVPEYFKRRYAYYWTTDRWKSDFLTALETQFWAYKDYAHGADKGKMPFLRELAEVWIAAATTALVRYGANDKRGWRATANMLRRHADMIEADGLRALPWGAWGHLREDVACEVEPAAGAE